MNQQDRNILQLIFRAMFFLFFFIAVPIYLYNYWFFARDLMKMENMQGPFFAFAFLIAGVFTYRYTIYYLDKYYRKHLNIIYILPLILGMMLLPKMQGFDALNIHSFYIWMLSTWLISFGLISSDEPKLAK